MTERYLGSIITSTPVEPSEGFSDSTASGVWNIHDPLIFGQASDWPDPTSVSPSKFIENIFSCFAYNGNGSTQSINNGIDLDGKGGLVWIKSRANSNFDMLFDTERGVQKYLISSETDAQGTDANSVTAFNSNGFSLGSLSDVNNSSQSTISWTFRKQPKFFDVVTYTGNDTAGRTVSHNLGSVPGMIIIKCTSVAHPWPVFHRGITDAEDKIVKLNKTDAAGNAYTHWNRTEPTATEFTLGTEAEVNQNGATYVAYLFAHNNSDGGFGSGGDQDIIKCGSYTGNASANGPEIDLGFEPQWLLIKSADNATRWVILDNIRGLADGSTPTLLANTSAAEASESLLKLTATGFKILDADTSVNASGSTITYVAIRRGPMQIPTVATDVFAIDAFTGSTPNYVSGFVTDTAFARVINSAQDYNWGSRLTGTELLQTNKNAAALTDSNKTWDFMNGYNKGSGSASSNHIGWMFRRAPNFHDVVIYVGTGSARTVTHNLGAVPQLMIVKDRDNAKDWIVYSSYTGNTKYARLNQTNDFVALTNPWNDTTPTSSVFTVGATHSDFSTNTTGVNYVAYLFASLDGICKIGNYTGNGSSQTIDCGFSSGARFVLIKNVDTDGLSGAWPFYDTTRGIVAGNDKRLFLGANTAEFSSQDEIDPDSSGFTVVQQDDTNLNYSGEDYIFMAIA